MIGEKLRFTVLGGRAVADISRVGMCVCLSARPCYRCAVAFRTRWRLPLTRRVSGWPRWGSGSAPR